MATTDTRITPAMITEAVRDALERLVDRFNKDNDGQVAFDAEIGHDGQPDDVAQYTIDGGGRYGAYEMTLTIAEL